MSGRRRRAVVPVRVAVVAVGDELLSGFIVNTNAAWIGQRLSQIGATVVFGATVGDDEAAIVIAVREAITHADAVIVCGGLGPTSDDRTRRALASVGDVPLLRDDRSEKVLRDLLQARGRPVTAEQLVQVDLPQGSAVIPNSVGTAPGFRMTIEGHPLYAVPGPPSEMRTVVEAGVVPDLARRTKSVVVTRSLRTALVPETEVAALVEAVELAHPDVRIAYLASPAEVVVRLTAVGSSEKTVTELVETAAEDAWERLGDTVVGDANRTLAQAVVGLLAAADRTVAVAESLTGGGVAAALTDVAGASAAVRGGIVAYATALKHSLLGVDADLLADQGPVHRDVAIGMAAGVRERLGADYGVATTGVAGPDEQDGRPVGTVHVAVVGPSSALVISPVLHGDRDRIRRETVVHALDLLRRSVLGLPPRSGESHD